MMTFGQESVAFLGAATWRNFAEFYAFEHPTQIKRAMVLARTPETAADAVHDAFVEVFRRWDEIDSPGGYLSRAVVNRCRDSGRRAVRRDRLHLRLVAQRSADLPVLTARDEELWRALLTLPFNQRAAIALRYYDGHSEAEIAQLMDCPSGSVGP